MKKNLFKTIAEALQSGKIKDIDLPTENLDRRKLTNEEVKKIVKEEFEEAKSAEEAAEETKEGQWVDADLEHEINWVKALSLKEFFNKKSK